MAKPPIAPLLALCLALVAHERASHAQAARPAQTAQTAQTAAPPRSAFVFNVGPMTGFLGGVYPRVNFEWQRHDGRRGFEGPSWNLGGAVAFWPNEGGPTAAFAPRYQYDQQLVPGTRFFVSPYVGLDVGVGVVNLLQGGRPRFAGFAAPHVGLDLKLLLDRGWILGFRPVGVVVPLFFIFQDDPVLSVHWDVLYDIAISIGRTY